MPVFHKSNNRVLPANARAVDVARQAIQDLTPVEQRRYHNAFLVQGYQCLVYNALKQGQPCSCQAHFKAAATLLDQEGKMAVGDQNRLMTGLSFKVNLYGNKEANVDNMRDVIDVPTPYVTGTPKEGPWTPNTVQPTQRIHSNDGDNVFSELVDGDPSSDDDFGSNGPHHDVNIEQSDFDSGTLVGLGDATCGICFGRGFVGGFSVLAGWRQVLSTQWAAKDVDGFIEINRQPHTFSAVSVDFKVSLPRGFKGLDCLRVWNNTQIVETAVIRIDGQLVTYPLLYTVFDGHEHTVSVTFDEQTDWTHVEFQVDTGNEARLEFPRMSKGFDATKLDGLEDIQINMSPIVPYVAVRDVVVEASFGLGFVLTSAQLWNTDQRRVLGWDCNARVIQPNEILNLLPRRKPTQQQKTTHMIRDNQNGRRRT